MNIIDRVVSFFSPEAGAKRARARAIEDILLQRKYDGAGKGRRNPRQNPSTSANTEISAAARDLRNNHRDMVRNNPYAKKAVSVIAANVVGTGIKPSIQSPGSRALRNAKAAWRAWADTTACDYEGRKTFAGIQRLVMQSVAESGEVFIRARRSASTLPVPLRLQVLEADFLDTSKDGISTPGNGYIMQGIEFDVNGQRVAYWLYDYHPGENRLYRSMTSQRIPADEIAHIFYEERPGQIRGVPFGVSGMTRLRDFDEYEDAQLIRQKIAACFAAFVTDSKDPLPGEMNAGSYPIERVEPGMIEYLPPGKQVTFGNPPPADGYNDYSRRVLQGIAAGYGVTYEALTGDLSNVNFSSGRMGWIEMGRMIADWQELMLVPQLCDRVFQWWQEAGAIAGALAPNLTVSWTPPARMMIDPVKETKGLSEQVRNGFVSWQEAVRQMGYDPDMTADELKQDYERFDAAGFLLSCDPRYDPNRGGNMPDQEPDDDDTPDDNGDNGDNGQT